MDGFIGEIRLFAGTFAPTGWALCNGQIIPISQNNALFTLIGTTYGGDGRSTFGLPDLRGRVPIAQGQGTGLTNRLIGQNGGTETVSIDITGYPAHNHALTVTNVLATSTQPSNTMLLGQTAANYGFYQLASGTKQTATNGMCSYSGGSAPHLNVMPSFCISFIIALNGNFPTQP